MDRPPTPQTSDFATLREARSLWATGQRDAAIERFESAIKEKPANVRGLLETARALGQCYQIARAESLLDRITTLAGSDPTVAPLIAQSYRFIHRPLRAINALERLQQADLLAPILLAELAVLYEQTNQLAEALDAIEQCVSRSPGQAEPKLILARIQRELGATDAAEAVIDELQRTSSGTPLLRVRVLAEICQLRDAAADYDGAIAAIEQAKQLLRTTDQAKQLTRRRAAVNQSLRQISRDFDRTVLNQWREESLSVAERCSGLAHLFGFPRSGTTLLEQILAAHPDLVSTSERPVFAREIFPELCRVGGNSLSLASLRAVSDQQLIQLRNRYLDMHEAILGEPLRGRIHLDKNPNHTSLLIGLLRLFPAAKFLFAVRDPRDVVVSTYLRFFPLTEFSVAFLDWETLCSQYAFEMDMWCSVRELLQPQVLQIRYEDLVADWQAVSATALRFLGLDWHEAVGEYRSHLKQKVVNSPSQAAVRNAISNSAVGRWRHYERHLGPHLQMLEPYCRKFGYR